MISMASVQIQRSFLIVGGYGDGAGYLDSVHEFDRLTYTWVLREQKLDVARRLFPAITMPNDMEIC